MMAKVSREKHPEKGASSFALSPYTPRLKPGTKGRLLKQVYELCGVVRSFVG